MRFALTLFLVAAPILSCLAQGMEADDLDSPFYTESYEPSIPDRTAVNPHRRVPSLQQLVKTRKPETNYGKTMEMKSEAKSDANSEMNLLSFLRSLAEDGALDTEMDAQKQLSKLMSMTTLQNNPLVLNLVKTMMTSSMTYETMQQLLKLTLGLDYGKQHLDVHKLVKFVEDFKRSEIFSETQQDMLRLVQSDLFMSIINSNMGPQSKDEIRKVMREVSKVTQLLRSQLIEGIIGLDLSTKTMEALMELDSLSNSLAENFINLVKSEESQEAASQSAKSADDVEFGEDDVEQNMEYPRFRNGRNCRECHDPTYRYAASAAGHEHEHSAPHMVHAY